MSKALKITIGVSTAILIGAIVFLWLQSRNARGVSVALAGPDQVLLGVPFKMQANIINDSKNILKDVKLSINLPAGVVFVGAEQKKIIEFKDLGNLGEGSLVKEEFELMVLSGENSIKNLEAAVSFLPSALSSRFEKTARFDLVVRGPALVLDIAAPTKVLSGEEFQMDVSYRNVSAIEFRDLALALQYPPSFVFKSASLKPDIGNNTWSLGDLRPGSETKFSIKGNLVGPDNAVFDFKAETEGVFSGQKYVIAQKSAALAISPSPLSLVIDVNGAADYIAYPNDLLDYVLHYTNNTDVGLRDVIIRAKLVGAMFDLPTLFTNGVLRAADNTIVWSAANVPGLAVLAPGASGSVSFRVKVKADYPIRRLSDKNFILRVEGQIESPTVPPFVAAAKTLGINNLETKVGGQVKVDAKALFRDAASGIVNSGPLPLKVGQATNFTIHWLITNFSTDVRDVEMRAFLGGNVRATGVVKSNIAAAPVYNERTQEMVWKIDKIPATKGVLDRPLEAIFQVEVVPSVDQAGNFLTLTQPTSLKAIDDFTGLEISAGDIELTTQLSDDPTVSPNQGIVTQ